MTASEQRGKREEERRDSSWQEERDGKAQGGSERQGRRDEERLRVTGRQLLRRRSGKKGRRLREGERGNEGEFKRVRQTWTGAIFSSWSWGTGVEEVEE